MFFGLSLRGFWEAKLAPRRPKTATRRAETHPRGTKIAPRCAQEGSETAKEAMLGQHRSKEAWERENVEKTRENQCFLASR